MRKRANNVSGGRSILCNYPGFLIVQAVLVVHHFVALGLSWVVSKGELHGRVVAPHGGCHLSGALEVAVPGCDVSIHVDETSWRIRRRHCAHGKRLHAPRDRRADGHRENSEHQRGDSGSRRCRCVVSGVGHIDRRGFGRQRIRHSIADPQHQHHGGGKHVPTEHEVTLSKERALHLGVFANDCKRCHAYPIAQDAERNAQQQITCATRN